jgi:hypothetical protein
MLSLGIIGEYLWRMYFRVMDQPSYVICTQLSSEVAGDPSTNL